ncbi:hypothetical protein LTR36_005227 [Oleoguttula mirabilis]|uniref:Uncharacterized protein n=1 Tax=Oleoguttula mirabilis TaxID=1507867 RepID=A0AAV9JX63_9PEZI|nr:hypothetical protein LTR36_005227 [Oleoguttula mirabilis]
MATCIRSLLPVAALGIPIVDRAVFSLLTLYYGRLHGDAGLVEFARSTYTVALGQYSRRLETAFTKDQGALGQVQYQIFMCTSMALQFFEHLNEIEMMGPGHQAHVGGALKALKSCGPQALRKSPGMTMAFGGFRGVALFVAIKQRASTFLAEPEWLKLTSQNHDQSMRDRLNNIGLEIPALLEAADELSASIETEVSAQSFDVGLQLLMNVSELQRKLEQWLYSLRTSTSVPLYWPRGLPITHSEASDVECSRKYDNKFHQLNFSCGPIAGLLAHCWSLKLELLMASVDLHQLLLDNNDRSPDVLSIPESLSSDLHRDRSEAEETARLILETEPYLASCFEGVICLQAPLRIVARYFDRLEDAQA